jgi:hypothetical protein
MSVWGTVKRRRITLVSSRRTISVPGSRYWPRKTLRRPTAPLKGTHFTTGDGGLQTVDVRLEERSLLGIIQLVPGDGVLLIEVL